MGKASCMCVGREMLCCGRKWPPQPRAHTRAVDRETGHFPADFAEPLLFIKGSVSSGRAGGSVMCGIGFGGEGERWKPLSKQVTGIALWLMGQESEARLQGDGVETAA